MIALILHALGYARLYLNVEVFTYTDAGTVWERYDRIPIGWRRRAELPKATARYR